MKKVYTPVNKKLIGLFILLGTFGCDGRQNSFPTTLQKHQQQGPASTLLAKEVDNVKDHISSLPNKEADLVLGVNNGEEDLLKRFDDSYVFLNIEHQNPTAPRSLTVDFNDLTQLQGLANQLPGTFDKIILDDSTFKFTAWTKEHLAAFRDLLKVNGEFIFAPQVNKVAINQEVMQSKEAVIEYVITQTQPQTSEILITGSFAVPLNVIANLKAFLNYILIKHFVPENYVRILEQAFGTGNVQVEYDKKLPFTSHWSEDQIQPVLITATRR